MFSLPPEILAKWKKPVARGAELANWLQPGALAAGAVEGTGLLK